MDGESSVPSSSNSPFLNEILSFSAKNGFISEEFQDPFAEIVPQGSQPPSTAKNTQRKGSLHRSRTAPAMAVMRDLQAQSQMSKSKPKPEGSSVIKQAVMLLLIYLSIGVIFYSFNRKNFSGIETHPAVDALYFCIVTMCTIGYGDIAPLTPATKIFACVFVLFGFGFLDILLSGVVNYVLDLQENLILNSTAVGKTDRHSAKNYIVDTQKGRMRIRMKVGLALAVVVTCVGTGTLVLYFMEDLDWVDSIYLSVLSVTTVGYGDQAFETLAGRLFASVWLLVSTLGVARAFLYLAEARIDKRHRRIAKWVLDRNMTVEDLFAADMNHTGFISKSDSEFYLMERRVVAEERCSRAVGNRENLLRK
ncbi:hypothetical protein H6P81_004470 [Aristolochia fimbriata]|uniref:Potassium channel domain-containing protein n=1 Tax=Aristolochia fimbriata TaxID=158543 RepID=A0AAV7FI20_ARIFI|nr:hypothetical protein H6P81_004470 [Aristolochia fimbriata]